MSPQSNTLTGKVALVTGGSRGIGAAIAKRLAQDGAAVVITYAGSQGKAEQVVRGIEKAGGEVQEQLALRWFGGRRDFAQIQRAVERVKGERWEAFADRYGDWVRDLGLWLGRTKCGLSLKELARHAGVSNHRSLATVIRNFERRKQGDTNIQKAAKKAATFMTYKT